MKREQKHIDRIFQEKFKDFEASPSPNLWSKIEAKLDQKQPKKGVPLWWKVSGIAASFVLFFSGWVFYQNPSTSLDNTVVNEYNFEGQPFIEDNQVISNQSLKKNIIGEENDELTTSENSKLISTTTSPQRAPLKNPNLAAPSIAPRTSKKPSNNNSGIAFTKHVDEAIGFKNNAVNNPFSSFLTEVTFNKVVASFKKNLEENPITFDKNMVTDLTTIDNKNNLHSEHQVKEMLEENNLLAELEMSAEIAEQQNQNLVNKQDLLWTLKPQFSPVFNLASNSGSSVDPMLGNNSSEGNTSLSYGMLVTYKLANNLRLRSGVHQVHMSYTTNDVVFAPSVAGVASNQINFNESSNGFNVFNEIIYDANVTNPNARTFASKGDLQQQLGFIEVPLEVEWQLLEGKFGIYATGGASTLFLHQNSVGFQNETGILTIGENAAANTTSFSGNLGFGIEYQLSKRFNLNLEPSFRYQFNTFTNQTGGFNPYFFAIYSGINVKL